MAGKVKTWVWVVVGIAVLGILGIVAMAGIGLYFFTQHIETSQASPATAAQQFDDVKKRFGDQTPLIELDERGRFLKSNTDRQPPPNAVVPDAIHVMAYDPDDDGGRVVRLSIPFWLLRLNSGGQTIDFNGNKMDLEDLKLTVEDLERMGPTLIVDHRERSGSRVLVWSQ
jgi:hypothetical protein